MNNALSNTKALRSRTSGRPTWRHDIAQVFLRFNDIPRRTIRSIGHTLLKGPFVPSPTVGICVWYVPVGVFEVLIKSLDSLEKCPLVIIHVSTFGIGKTMRATKLHPLFMLFHKVSNHAAAI